MPDVQQPTIGERVHYRSHGSAPLSDGTQVYLPKCRTAIVVDVIAADACTLFVITPNGIFHDDCRRDEDGHDGGTWHMPCDQALAHD
jgi:hypothetical protein